MTASIVLCADDYAMTAGISRSILELAADRKLSATSAMVTSPHWVTAAGDVAKLRAQISVGLHLNLTLGDPLGDMPSLAPTGTLPAIGDVTAKAIGGKLDRAEIEAEIDRQCAAFEDALGFPPDHIDGHQHVHALPIVRDAFLAVLKSRYPGSPKPLIRNPADHLRRIVARGRAVPKALTLAWLARGFGTAVRTAGFPVNTGFAGVTGFKAGSTSADFAAAVTKPGPRHMVMCHPGYVDDELRRIDPVTDRRKAEHDTLAAGGFPAPLWHPDRSVDGPPVDWPREWIGNGTA